MNRNSTTDVEKERQSIFSSVPEVLTNIYQEKINIAVWQHKLSDEVLKSALALIAQKPHLKIIITVTPDQAYDELRVQLQGIQNEEAFCQHVSLLVDMFCTLFELKVVGIRLTVLDRPMCPRFHVDKIPCRLVTTFAGDTTQWLTNHVANRAKLGAGSQGLPDAASGLFLDSKDINQLSVGDVALLKGEGWLNNNGGGLIHRSPVLENCEHRLLLTLDFID